MRHREVTSEFIERSAYVVLVASGMLVAAFAMTLLAPPLGAQEIDGSTNDSNNLEVTTQEQLQDCPVIVQQYNNAVAGDAVAVGDAVAQTSATVNAPVNVVRTCIQAGGDIIIGSGDNDGNDSGNNDDNDDGNDSGNDDGNDSGNGDGSDDGNDNGGGGNDAQVCSATEPLGNFGSDEGLNESEIVEVTGSAFRVNYTAIYDDDDSSLVIGAREADIANPGSSEREVSPQPSGFLTFRQGPGAFEVFAEVDPEGSVDYEIEVLDCVGGSSDSGTDDTETNNTETASRESSVIPGTYDDGAVLAKTGGSTEAMISAAPLSAGLVSGGGLLVLCGVGIAFWLGRESFSGRG